MTIPATAHTPLQAVGWQVRPEDPFAVPQRIPDGVDPASLSRFGDPVWVFSPLIPKHQHRKSVNWASFSPPLRDSWRRAAWAFLNLPTPDELLDRAMTQRIRWPSADSVHTMMNELRRFDRWLTVCGITTLDRVDEETLLGYATHISGLKLSLSRSTAALYTVSRLWAAAPHLPEGDRIAMPPWEHTSLCDYLPGVAPHSNENATRPIHPAVISPLLIWSLRFTQDFATDIINVWNHVHNGGAPPAVTGLLHAKPWTGPIKPAQARTLMRMLSTACLVVVAYLSGLRPAEVLWLRKGCCPPPVTDGTQIRYEMQGNFFKGARDEHGRTQPGGKPRTVAWTVIEPVAHAISVLEQISSSQYLFANRQPWLREAPFRNEIVSSGTITRRFRQLVEWINQYAGEHGLSAETIPDDPHGSIVLSRLRRTIAWHIARLPQGRIALAIQYGHLRALHSDGYAGRGRDGLRQVIDVESAMGIAQFLQEVADRLEAGEGVSGPAAQRMLQSAALRAARFEGAFLPDRDLRAILSDPQFQVYDNPDAFLTCNKDPDKALCDPQRHKRGRLRPPALDRCDPACANIARTDSHINAARAEITRLQAEADDPLTPSPLAGRQRQRIATLHELVDRHERTRITLKTAQRAGEPVA